MPGHSSSKCLARNRGALEVDQGRFKELCMEQEGVPVQSSGFASAREEQIQKPKRSLHLPVVGSHIQKTPTKNKGYLDSVITENPLGDVLACVPAHTDTCRAMSPLEKQPQNCRRYNGLQKTYSQICSIYSILLVWAQMFPMSWTTTDLWSHHLKQGN